MTALFDKGPFAPCPTPFNLAAHVLRRAEACGDTPALILAGPERDTVWTFAQLQARVLGIAGGLQAQGLRPGARILLRLGNTVEFPLAYLGAIAAGMVPVPTSAQLTTPEITAICAGLAPDLIIAGSGVALPAPLPCPVLTEEAFHALADHPPAAFDMGDPNRAAYIIYTSGTAGVPRAVVHAHRAVWARQMMVQGWYDLRPDDRVFHAGAFNWTYTLGTGLLDPWAMGATAIIPEAGQASADLPALLARHGTTIFAAAPGVYRQMLAAGPLPETPSLRHGLSAGEKLSPQIRQRWEAATGTAIHEAFGMSECSTFISGAPTHPAPDGTLGYPQPGRRLAILDAEGVPVAIDTPGTIAVHRSDPGLMLGYLGAEGDTRARFTADGAWFLTGDQGSMAADHAITYLGRADDMMNAGGYRVSPIEVETALRAHPGLTEVAAVEVPLKPGVTGIAAFYTGLAEVPQDELAAFAETRLARYKRPKLYRKLDALPHGANGKILRRALRDAYEGPQ
ncbi:class I adenylate-forming enzyme family protein [Fluviibacterium sp. DFM31]|uniref:Class I adenylate-forming enzyme family protein n=1 Tax=Meridianimarinicoccus marinus TaxID=3231483 RepID=A0ABV3LA78_9RHOB